MLRVDNYSRLPSLTSAYSDDPEGHDADVTRPVLLPPGATRPILATPLSEESQLKRQAYTGYFIQHLVRFTMSSVSFGLSLAAAVLSGGAGIPLAVVTGTAMIIAAGDACCALYNLIQVRNDREPLKTGNDSIVLATKTLMTTCGMSDSHAETVGDVASCAFRIGIALSSIFVPSAHLPGSTAHTLSSISSGITAVLTIAGGGIDMYTARVERMQGSIIPSATPASAVVEADEKSATLSQEELQRMVDSVVACYERYRAQRHAPTVSPAW
ncbi:hypothetical protein ABFY47_24915 [Enterobacter ludwigii]|uniref:hypothetical protein n=1 Tax=Enterobacter ludwigii TaxID=299767 RepID=UPI003D1BF0E0